MTNEEIARGNATQWCRCFKCDGIIRDSNIKCDKDKLVTCTEWYDGYRTALMACRDKDQQFKEYLEKKKEEVAKKMKEHILYSQPDEFYHNRVMFCNEIINEFFPTIETNNTENDE